MIYFDNSATTKPYKEVLDSYVKVSTDFFGNPSSLHGVGGKAEKLLAQARMQIAGLLQADTEEIFFTSGGTESNNLAIKGAARAFKNRGRHIIASAIEHPSVSGPLNQLEAEGFSVTIIPPGRDGRIDPADIEKAITNETILVSLMHVNNEVGAIQPIEEVGAMLKRHPKIVFHSDGVQAVGKLLIDLRQAGVDLYSFSAHKFHGLKGSGGIFIRKGLKLEPVLTGGSQERGQRGGTENPAGAAAMAKALRLSLEKKEVNETNMREISSFLRDKLEKLDGIIMNTPREGAVPYILNFSVPGIRSETFVHALEEFDVFVSTTSACSSKRKTASKTLLAMGAGEEAAGSAIRISLSYENTLHEAENVIAAIEKTVARLGRVLK